MFFGYSVLLQENNNYIVVVLFISYVFFLRIDLPIIFSLKANDFIHFKERFFFWPETQFGKLPLFKRSTLSSVQITNKFDLIQKPLI